TKYSSPSAVNEVMPLALTAQFFFAGTHFRDKRQSMKRANEPGNEGKRKRLSLSLAERGLTDADLAQAAKMSSDCCPRRYCWWWGSALFEWDRSPSDMCTFLHSPKPTGYQPSDVPCCRSDATSLFDHFEPREPFLEADEIDGSKWLMYRYEKNS